MKETNEILVKPITRTLGSIASYSSTIYIILLTLSICYNIGYLKQINPQIIDLIELGDYINDTIHNIWLFLLGALIFFMGSLLLVKINVSEAYNKVLVFGIFAFIVSLHYLLKGTYSSKFWPIISKSLENNNETLLTVFLYIIILFVSISFIYYAITFRVNKDKEKGAISTGIAPILMFLILVLIPYIAGMSQGYIENKYLTKEDYQDVHSVNIYITPGDEILKNVYIVKKLNKGLIIRNFNNQEEIDSFNFINWNNIKYIAYERLERLLLPI